MAGPVWYYSKNGERVGPFSPAQVRQMATAGMVGPDDLLMREGGVGWVRAAAISGLFGPGRGASPAASEPGAVAPVARARRPGFAPNLVEVARWHRWLARSAMLYLCLAAAGLVIRGRFAWAPGVPATLTWPPLCYFLARALKRPAGVYAALAAVPLVNLGVLVDLSGRAVRVLLPPG